MYANACQPCKKYEADRQPRDAGSPPGGLRLYFKLICLALTEDQSRRVLLYLASINLQGLRGILQLRGGRSREKNKASGTGRRMATFVANRVEIVNDEVKGDSRVQLQSLAQSLARPAGFASR